jgi:RNA polymerase sigma-70 factor (ECF subfamily)
MQPSHSPANTPFLTTRWSLVLAAGQGGEPRARAALGELCQTYWYPLYAYVRRRGFSTEDAQDLTQSFFARLLERNTVGSADPQRGRFRAFLLSALKNFLANEWDKVSAQKRGGGAVPLSLDFRLADQRFAREPEDPRTPERAYERSWALSVLERVLDRIGEGYRARGRGALFDALRPALVGGEASEPYAEIARRLGTSEGAVKVAAHRLRGTFREELRAEIAQTVERPEDLEEELEYLIAALAAE